MNYKEIKQIAKKTKRRAVDLIALTPNNDPFYFGTAADLEDGRWFADLWNRFGYGTGVHLRRVHYQVVSQQAPVLMPNGRPYENTEACWKHIGVSSKAARYLNLVRPDAFVDRRNPEAVIPEFVPPVPPQIYITDSDYSDAELPAFPDLPDYGIEDYTAQQRYHIEVWAEKSTMNDVLLPLCSQYGAVLQTGMGEMSITSALAAVERVLERGRPGRIFYVSDFDPAGQSMPVAVSRKIEYFIRDRGLDLDVRLTPIVLTPNQVQQYRLPRTPIKETEIRAVNFESRHGSGAVELDALEALHPGELRRILSNSIERYFDRDLYDQVWMQKSALYEDLRRQRQAISERHESDINYLRREYEAISEEFRARMASHQQRRSNLWAAIETEMMEAAPNIEDYPIPTAVEAEDVADDLFVSQRDYMNQLTFYKQFQGKE
jgi:hypothetical protein